MIYTAKNFSALFLKPELTSVPSVFIVATPAGANSKVLGFNGSCALCKKILLSYLKTVVIKWDFVIPAPPVRNLQNGKFPVGFFDEFL